MELRKPKFVGKKTKWEKRRIVRSFARTAKGKKPLVEPLTIASMQERQAAFKKGRMVFYDGNEKIELPLLKEGCNLVGIYRAGLGIVTIRSEYLGEGSSRIPIIELYTLNKGSNGFFEKRTDNFFFNNPNLGHMSVPAQLRGRGLALKIASRTERHVRATRSGKHSFEALEIFKDVFTKLGYKDLGRVNKGYGGSLHSVKMEKTGKEQRKDDLYKFHRIEAIDPKTGKARIFTFPIQKTSSN